MRGKKAVSAGVSVAILVPVVMLTAMLLVATVMQSELSQRAAGNAANLRAEEGKKLLRVSALRGPSNESLVNLYAAGKLPIDVDYLLAVATNGTVLAERSGSILTLNPGDNVTLAPSQLDPRLAAYDGDFWRMKREVRELLLHTSDGNTYYLSWGPWGGFMAATFTTNTATTTTSLTTTTSTFTVTISVIQTIYVETTRMIFTTTGGPQGTTTTNEQPLFASASCTVSATYYWNSLGWYDWSNPTISCTVNVQYAGGPPYSYTLSAYGLFGYGTTQLCGTSGTASSNSFSAGCSKSGRVYSGDDLNVRVDITVSKSGGPSRSISGTCSISPGPLSGTSTCYINM